MSLVVSVSDLYRLSVQVDNAPIVGEGDHSTWMDQSQQKHDIDPLNLTRGTKRFKRSEER